MAGAGVGAELSAGVGAEGGTEGGSGVGTEGGTEGGSGVGTEVGTVPLVVSSAEDSIRTSLPPADGRDCIRDFISALVLVFGTWTRDRLR
jgi:hypothetical protein